jgi:methylenetetrahydrofolate reductase (NADPH)
MKIRDAYKNKKCVISFEIFPPKKDGDINTVYDTVGALKLLKPDFISVTYGAAGDGDKNKTAEIASVIKEKYKIESLAHLTLTHLNKDNVGALIGDFLQKKIENILCLRGDESAALTGGFKYAKDLIAELKPYGFCIGAAAYPEAHISCDSLDTDIAHLKQKQDSGADFLITQLFFDNEIFYRFIDRARKKGVTLPVSAGIMPILGRAQIERMIFMCGASLPPGIIKLVNRYGDKGDDLIKAGVEYTYRQMQNLCDNGAQGVHIYTMNKPFIAKYCMDNLRL